MKVLQIIDSLNTGGAESLLVDLCLRWKRDGLSPEVFVLHHGSQAHHARLQDAGIEIHGPVRSRVYSPKHVGKLVAAMSRTRFDLVHVHLYPAQLWTALALRRIQVAPPGITTEHNTWNHRREHRWCQARLTVGCILNFGWPCASVLRQKDRLDAWQGPGVCPTCVVANGIDLTRFHQHNVPAHLPAAIHGAPTILCVGSLTDRKDQQTLVRALAEVEGVHILLVGDGELRQRVRAVAVKLHVDGRVHFLGIRHDIPELIAAADLYVQPSRVDGFCIATLEAMAGGLAVIASDIPGLRDVVGDAGLLFPAGDHLRLAQCIRSLLLNPGLRHKLSACAVNRARQFSIDKSAAEYERIFEAAASKSISAGHYMRTA